MPRNVQIALFMDDRSFTLSYHEGVFLTVNPESDELEGVEDSSEHIRDHMSPHIHLSPRMRVVNWRQFTMRGMSYKLQ